MIKKRRNLFIMLVVIVLMLSTTVGAIVASSNETRFNSNRSIIPRTGKEKSLENGARKV